MNTSFKRLFGWLAGITLGISGFAAIPGCGLPSSAPAENTQNLCTTDSDCGQGAVCRSLTSGSMCVGTHSDLGTVFLDVRPTPDAHGNTVSHVFTSSLALSGDDPRGMVVDLPDLVIPPKVTFSGKVTFADDTSGCTASDGSVPATVELHAKSNFAELIDTFTGTATASPKGAYSFAIDVPSGHYDAYVAPTPFGSGCTVPLLPPRIVNDIDATTNLELDLDSTTQLHHLAGTLSVPTGTSVAGWTLQIVEPTYGLVISDTETLSDPPSGQKSISIIGANGEDAGGLRYFRAPNADSPIVRLRDKEGKLAVHWQLDSLDLDGNGVVEIKLNDLLAKQIDVQATVIDPSTKGVDASVTIESVTLTGTNQNTASFHVYTTTDKEKTGVINVSLVPGTYRVLVSPTNSNDLANLIEEPWEIKEGTLGFGKTFTLPERPSLVGSVDTVTDASAKDLSVVVTPSSPAVATYFDQVIGNTPLMPREGTSITNDAGDFTFPVDPGTVNFSVQPNATSGFPWLVVPYLLVNDASIAPTLNLKSLTLPAPVMVSGTVRSGAGRVPSAVVRALLAISPKEGDTTTKLVQIGETVTDESGQFLLPLPPSVSLDVSPSSD